MSTNVERMIRSHILMFEMIAAEAGDAAEWIIRRQLSRLHVELARNNFARFNGAAGMRNLGRALELDRTMAARSVKYEFVRSFKGGNRLPPSSDRGFHSFSVDDIDGPWTALRSIEALGELAAMDQESTSGLPDHLAGAAF